MGDVTENLVETLRLLESRRRCTAAELAAALQVGESTVRRSIARLRELGLVIEAESGPAGGYALGAGRDMPPLLLDDAETTAVALALRQALRSPAPLVEEGTLKALAKVTQVMPARIHASMEAHRVDLSAEEEAVERALAVIGEGMRGGRVVSFRVLTEQGPSGRRFVEPLAVRARGGQWYLMGYDRDLSRITTWAAEQLVDAEVTTIRYSETSRRARRACEALPTQAPVPVVAIIEVQAPPARVRAGLPTGVGFIEPLDDNLCRVMLSGTNVTRIARLLLQLPELFTVVEPEELRLELRAIGEVLAGV